MNQSDINPLHFIFRSTIKGLLWSAVGTLLALCIIWLIFFSPIIFTVPNGDETNIFQEVLHLLGGLLYLIFESIMFSILTFFVLGIPITILPASIASLFLSIVMYRESKANKISRKKGGVIGGIIGCMAGFASLLLPSPFETAGGLSELLASFSKTQDTYIIFWAILIVVPCAGFITGNLFGKNLANELEQKKPEDEYFSIDWEALLKEQQQENSTHDTSPHDT